MFSVTPLLAVLSPALGALLIAVTGERRANLRDTWSVAAGLAMFALVASMIPAVLTGRTPACVLFRILPGIELAFRVDAFGLLFGTGASLLWILTPSIQSATCDRSKSMRRLVTSPVSPWRSRRPWV